MFVEFRPKQWEKVSSTSLSDAMMGLQTMSGEVKPLNPAMRAAGPAYTVQIIKNDCSVIFRALRDAQPGSVLVVAAHGEMNVAFMGEIVAAIGQKKGLAGIVVDGCVRDSFNISSSTFPVFARGAVPNIPAAVYAGTVQEQVQCAGVLVSPGDIVYGDADGVVVVPAKEAETVLQFALEKEKKDKWKMNTLLNDEQALDEFLTRACGDTKQ